MTSTYCDLALLFNIYMKLLGEIIHQFKVQYILAMGQEGLAQIQLYSFIEEKALYTVIHALVTSQ